LRDRRDAEGARDDPLGFPLPLEERGDHLKNLFKKIRYTTEFLQIKKYRNLFPVNLLAFHKNTTTRN
jgi:hypothetical protein